MQRNRTNKICVHIEKKTYFKELAHTILEAISPKCAMVSWQMGGQGKANNVVHLQSIY
jgi:hypothetical protein